jgi:hypothetical protein
VNGWLALALGLIVGASIGVLVAALMRAAAKGSPPPPPIPEHRLDALDRIAYVKQLTDAGRFGEACRLVGITHEQADAMTTSQLASAFEVRIQAIARKAGLE